MTHDKVVHDLHKKYQCYLGDHSNPQEYPYEILKDLYDNAHNIVVEKIKKQLNFHIMDPYRIL